MWSSARNLTKRKNEPRTRLQADDGAAAARGAGARQGVTSSSLPTGLDEFEPAFGAMSKAAMQAVSINADGLIYQAKGNVCETVSAALGPRPALDPFHHLNHVGPRGVASDQANPPRRALEMRAGRSRETAGGTTPVAVASVLPSAYCGSRPARPSTVEWPAVQDGAWRGQRRQQRNGSGMSGVYFARFYFARIAGYSGSP